jgi:hypothetical protein
MGGACNTYGRDERKAQKMLVRRPEGSRQLRRLRHRWEDNIIMDI